MTAIAWGAPGAKVYETGLDRGVLYLAGGVTVPWNGLVSVTDNVDGGELESYYYDGVKYMDAIMPEDTQVTIEAYAAPEEFKACEGKKQLALGLYATAQPRVTFGMSYRTQISTDLSIDTAYKLHLLYTMTVEPSEKAHTTKSKDSSLPSRTWVAHGVPPGVAAYFRRPTAQFIIDSRYANPAYLTIVTNKLWGTASIAPILPTQEQVITALAYGTAIP